MALATYTELQTAIGDTLNREDLSAVIPTFIRMAESRIDREVRHWRQEKRSVAALDAQFSALPGDFLQPIRLQITDGPTSDVTPLSTAQMLQMRYDRGDLPGRPVHYAVTAASLEMYPTPDAPYNSEMVYHGRVTPLSATDPVNWLLTEAPDVYLYGALVHSAPYLKDDARIQIWEALFAQGISNLNMSSDAAKWGGSGLVIRTRRGAP
jgi:hypothetical protein